MELFHAYIIGGDREAAQAHIAELLSGHNIDQSGNPDYVETTVVSFAIDNARELKEWQVLAPVGDRKVHVVYADFITREAENALLKTLEEPAPNTHIIFAVPQPDMLLATLRSRVRVVDAGHINENGTAGKRFLQSSIPDRLKIVQKLIEKSDEEDASAEARARVLSFINELEAELSKNVEKNAEALATILKLKKHVYVSGASLKLIVETLGLVL